MTTWQTFGTIGFGLLAVLVAFVLFLHIIYRIGLQAKIDDIGHFVRGVMSGGYDGCRLRLRHVASGRYVEFVKLIPRTSPTRFVMRLDRHAFSQEELRRAIELLSEQGIDADIEKVVPYETNRLEQIYVDCGTDTTKAVNAARIILQQILGIGPNDTLRAGLKGGLDVGQGARHGWD